MFVENLMNNYDIPFEVMPKTTINTWKQIKEDIKIKFLNEENKNLIEENENLIEENEDLSEENENLILENAKLQSKIQNLKSERLIIFMVMPILFIIVTFLTK